MDGLLLVGLAVAAGAVAVGVTLAIERWGGVVGGLLGTLPTTIVPASWGIWAAAPDASEFTVAMAAVPLGMLVDALFLYLWRVLPPRLPRGLLARGVGWPLAVMLGVTLVAWAGLAAIAVVGFQRALDGGLPPLAVGGLALLTNVGVGVLVTRARVPAPSGARRVSAAMLLARGLLAGLAIALSTGLAHSGDGLLAGLASVFPAIFITTMVGLWVSQGHAVPSGAVGPMMLGASSVGAYALLCAVLWPTLGPIAGTPIAWILAAVGVTGPAYQWVRTR